MTEEEYFKESIEIERLRLKLEQQKARRELQFFHRHLGAILTAAISVATFVISGVQIYLSQQAKEEELNLQAIVNDQKLNLARQQHERDWRVSFGSFVSENKSEIFDESSSKTNPMHSLMIAVFPPEITESFFSILRRTASQGTDVEKQFAEAAKTAKTLIDPRVYIHIIDTAQRPKAGDVQIALEGKGIAVPGIQLVRSKIVKSHLRVFKKTELGEGEKIKKILIDKGFKIGLVDLSEEYKNSTKIRPKHYELWLGADF